MKSFDTAGETSDSHPHADQTEVAELATKLAALPHDAATLQQHAAAHDKPASATDLGAKRHGWIWWICYLIAWAATLTLAVVAGLRIFYHDGHYLLTWINAFTRYVYLPAYGCLIWAAWQQQRILTLASSVVVLCHLVWLAPDFMRDGRFDPLADTTAQTAAASPSVRVFFANVFQPSREFDSMFQDIAAADPDVIVFAEWGWAWGQAFQESPLAAAYSHGASVGQPLYGHVNIFSKLPLKNESISHIDGRIVRAVDIELGTKTLRLLGLHAARPLHPDQREYLNYWNQMLARLATETRPLMVIGDFNATQHSLVYKQLEASGLRSAHEDRRRGYATTWPNDVGGVSLIRIDQAFLSPEVECQRVVEGVGKGSDHKPLVVDVRVR